MKNFYLKTFTIFMFISVIIAQCDSNNWQEYYPNLQGCQLENADLSGQNMWFGDFTSANLTNADRTPGSYTSVDFLSNGFQIRASNDGINKSGNQFVYMAFAEHPFVGDGTNPVTAR